MDNYSTKRKRKRSIVQTVKKKFKNNFSRALGTRLESDIHEYFLRVFQQSKQPFENTEERSVFIDNVFTQTEGHEIEYCSNQLVSRVIEEILPESSNAVLERYLSVFFEDIRPICSHPFASHVLETLIKISSKKVFDSINQKKKDNDSESVEVFLNFVLKISKYLINNLNDFYLDTYANPVTRSAILCLCGDIEMKKPDSRFPCKSNMLSLKPKVSSYKKYPDEFKKLHNKFADTILNSHMFSEFAKNVMLSGLVQTMLLSLQFVGEENYLNIISLKLLDVIYNPDSKQFNLMTILNNQEAVHLLNTMIITSTETIYEAIRTRLFSSQFKIIALNQAANYCVQKLIERCTSVATFDLIYEELCDCFEEIINAGHTGVLFSISKICRKLKRKEKTFIKDMIKSFGCESDDKNFVLSLLTMNKGQLNGDNKLNINLHGCFILQEMLNFTKPNMVIKSLLDIKNEELLQILCDQKGSYIANAFFNGDNKSDKFTHKFLDKLKGSYVKLSTTKYGSFVISAIWKAIDVDSKLIIVKELASKESLIKNSPCGKYIAKTVGIETYNHQPNEWINAQKQIIKSRELFSDIVNK